jgi:CheY-like chemotaxis protein
VGHIDIAPAFIEQNLADARRTPAVAPADTEAAPSMTQQSERTSEATTTTNVSHPDASDADERTPTPSHPVAPSRSLRILVVDDDHVDRMALTRALRRTGFHVTLDEADGVIAAIDRLATGPFDCVFLDYNLPDGDGLTFLRGLRGAGSSARVIMITGQEDAGVAGALIAAGAADYIPKALVTTDRITRSLERVFGPR